jgi:hypothetical protein
MNKRTPCPKSGIKIHETPTQRQPQPQPQYSRVNYHDTPMSELDLNLDNYSLSDLFNLFNIQSETLDDNIMYNAKQITLKMHPDKSRLDPKFFIFFRKAYERLNEIYKFQNKSLKKSKDTNDVSMSEDQMTILKNFETQNKFENKSDFNQWFNQNFEKYRIDNPNERGYGDWLKSDDNIINVNENVTMSNMNQIFEQKKKQIQAVTVYSGIQNDMASFKGSSFSLLNDGDNFSSEHYTDLKQAYTETVIPVTLDDYEKMPKFNNVEEYKSHRRNVDVTPIDNLEAMRILERQERNAEKESQALAYRYAREAEKAKENQNMFWSALKQLTG